MKTTKSDLLTADEAGRYLGGESRPIPLDTLSYWRKCGRGPSFLKLGKGRSARIRYRRADLDDWLSECETSH